MSAQVHGKYSAVHIYLFVIFSFSPKGVYKCKDKTVIAICRDLPVPDRLIMARVAAIALGTRYPMIRCNGTVREPYTMHKNRSCAVVVVVEPKSKVWGKKKQDRSHPRRSRTESRQRDCRSCAGIARCVKSNVEMR